MRAAERLSADLERQLRAGEAASSELGAAGSRGPRAPLRAACSCSRPDAKAVAAAAQAFADRARDRARERTGGLAA